MQTKEEIVSAKIFQSSKRDLRLVAAMTGETQQQVIKRLLTQERQKLALP